MMNYKTRLILLFVALFLVVLASILSFIYVFYADFRRDEFFERLRQKSITTAKLLVEVKEVDKKILKIIDQNSINRMYDEKILIFDEKNELIYSSLDDEVIVYSPELIEKIRQNEEQFYVDDDGDEIVGIHYTSQGQNYVILASAYDKYGINKLKNLKNLLFGALVLGTVLITLSSYFYINQVFKPIDALNRSIQTINENNLREFIPVKKNRDELDKLALNYNSMLDRLFKAFESQRSFVRNAAHELKTPLALLFGKVENLMDRIDKNDSSVQAALGDIMNNIIGQASLVESLLLLHRLQSQVPVQMSPVRVDEILFDCQQNVSVLYPHLKTETDIRSEIQTEGQLTVTGNAMLLKTCFRNLVENAALYASDNFLHITLSADPQHLKIVFSNSGDEPLPAELVFEPFYRCDGQGNPGNGLGLSIVKQIVTLMHGSVEYAFQNGMHCFVLRFLIQGDDAKGHAQ